MKVRFFKEVMVVGGGALTMGYDENGKIIRKTIYGKSRAEVVKNFPKLVEELKVILMI